MGDRRERKSCSLSSPYEKKISLVYIFLRPMKFFSHPNVFLLAPKLFFLIAPIRTQRPNKNETQQISIIRNRPQFRHSLSLLIMADVRMGNIRVFLITAKYRETQFHGILWYVFLLRLSKITRYKMFSRIASRLQSGYPSRFSGPNLDTRLVNVDISLFSYRDGILMLVDSIE